MLSFQNSYALNEEVGDMPERDLTVEMWVRTPAYKATAERVQNSELVSYATHTTGSLAPREPLLALPNAVCTVVGVVHDQAGAWRCCSIRT